MLRALRPLWFSGGHWSGAGVHHGHGSRVQMRGGNLAVFAELQRGQTSFSFGGLCFSSDPSHSGSSLSRSNAFY